MSASRVRILAVGLVVVVVASLGTFVSSKARATTRFRDVAASYPFETSARSWDIDVGDLTGDGIPDLVLSHHAFVGFYRVGPVDRFFRVGGGDPHGCAIADVDLNGRGDVYCTRGAALGTIEKRNRLWIHRLGAGYVDRAGPFGVLDRYGRGRHTTFLDLNGDPYPDLFVGNEYPRLDGRPTVNRTFVNVDGEGFRQVRIGATEAVGGDCAVPGDLDGDGWEDLVVCGQERLHLYRNGHGGNGDRALHDVAPALGLDLRGVASAILADLGGSDAQELVVVRASDLTVFRRATGGFVRTFRLPLVGGRWVTWGDLDGRHGPDLFVVQGCVDGRNRRDVALLDRGTRPGYSADAFVPAASGCGDVAAAADLDLDGRDEVIVLNGAMGFRPNGGIEGPVQVLTLRGAT